MKHLFLLLSFATLPLVSWAADFFLQANQPVVVAVPAGEAPVVQTATDLLARDMKTVLGAEMLRNDSRPQILIATYRHLSKQQQKHLQIDASLFQGQAQAFLITVARDGLLAIVGSDEYGTAYGIIELTRMLGVSAWEWWADVTPYRMDNFRLKQGFARFSERVVPWHLHQRRGLCFRALVGRPFRPTTSHRDEGACHWTKDHREDIRADAAPAC